MIPALTKAKEAGPSQFASPKTFSNNRLMSVSNESDGNDDSLVCDNMFNLSSPLQLMVIFSSVELGGVL